MAEPREAQSSADLAKRTLDLHARYRGKMQTAPKVPLRGSQDLTVWYAGVAEPLSLSETHTLIYWRCSPPKIGTASTRPTLWAARGIVASLCSDRCCEPHCNILDMEQVAKVALAKHNDMVKAAPP